MSVYTCGEGERVVFDVHEVGVPVLEIGQVRVADRTGTEDPVDPPDIAVIQREVLQAGVLDRERIKGLLVLSPTDISDEP